MAIYLQELVMDEIVAFKNPAFEEEREWRIVVRPRLIEMQRATDGKEDAAEEASGNFIQFLQSKGSLVRYLVLSRRNRQIADPFSTLRAILGPASHTICTVGFLIETQIYRHRSCGI